MLSVDLHMHTNSSHCGLHSYLEMLDAAASKGLDAVAITDHGPTLGGRGINSVFLKRFPSDYKGVKVFKGIELNALEDGKTDMPMKLLPDMDLVLLAIHPNIEQGKGEDYYTDMLLACMEQNPFVDVLSHPDISFYPIDMECVVRMAASYGIAMEFNNSNITYKKTNLEKMKEMAHLVKELSCPAIVSGDAHSFHEIGEDSDIVNVCKELEIEMPSIINENLGTATEFIERRKKNKLIK